MGWEVRTGAGSHYTWRSPSRTFEVAGCARARYHWRAPRRRAGRPVRLHRDGAASGRPRTAHSTQLPASSTTMRSTRGSPPVIGFCSFVTQLARSVGIGLGRVLALFLCRAGHWRRPAAKGTARMAPIVGRGRARVSAAAGSRWPCRPGVLAYEGAEVLPQPAHLGRRRCRARRRQSPGRPRR